MYRYIQNCIKRLKKPYKKATHIKANLIYLDHNIIFECTIKPIQYLALSFPKKDPTHVCTYVSLRYYLTIHHNLMEFSTENCLFFSFSSNDNQKGIFLITVIFWSHFVWFISNFLYMILIDLYGYLHCTCLLYFSDGMAD